MTLLEIIADLIDEHAEGRGMPRTGTMLVPEQCMEVVFEDKTYHLTLVEIPEEKGDAGSEDGE